MSRPVQIHLQVSQCDPGVVQHSGVPPANVLRPGPVLVVPAWRRRFGQTRNRSVQSNSDSVWAQLPRRSGVSRWGLLRLFCGNLPGRVHGGAAPASRDDSRVLGTLHWRRHASNMLYGLDGDASAHILISETLWKGAPWPGARQYDYQNQPTVVYGCLR